MEKQESITETSPHNICDYSDMDYVSFWKTHNRAYEDCVERMALRRLTANISGTCLEIGAGYGRLVNEYAGFCSDVLLTDYAQNLLDQARIRVEQLGFKNVRCMRANLYDLIPLGKKFNNAICIRVLHHVENVPDFLNRSICHLKRTEHSYWSMPTKKLLLKSCVTYSDGRT